MQNLKKKKKKVEKSSDWKLKQDKIKSKLELMLEVK